NCGCGDGRRSQTRESVSFPATEIAVWRFKWRAGHQYQGEAMRWTRLTMMMVATLLTGGGLADTVRSELSTSAQPTGTAVAHSRLPGSRNVKAYPGSTCASKEVRGSGFPAGPKVRRQRRRPLGMTNVASTPKHN